MAARLGKHDDDLMGKSTAVDDVVASADEVETVLDNFVCFESSVNTLLGLLSSHTSSCNSCADIGLLLYIYMYIYGEKVYIFIYRESNKHRS